MSQPAPLPAPSSAPSLDPALVAALLDAALTAPSGDNCQPWRLVPRADGAFDLRFVPARAASIFDVEDLASRMALGALLETLRIAASAAGVSARWRCDPDRADPELWARLWLDARAQPADELAGAIRDRYTHRGRYDGAPLSPTDAAALRAQRASPARLHLITDAARLAAVAGLIGEADRIRSECRRAHEDLQRWLRFDDGAARATRDGLDVRTLGLGPVERPMLRLLRPWGRMRVALRLGVAGRVASRARDLVLGSAAVGLITVPSATAPDALAAGRLLQRVWLRATERRLAFSPMAALPLLALRVERLGGEGLDPAHRERLAELGAALREAFDVAPGTPSLMLFRVGHAPPLAARALRRGVDELVRR